jgi:hypothetical protein
MNIKRFLFVISAISTLILACFKEDDRVIPYPGDIITIPDSIQKYQSYFDLESGSVVASHPINAWQLGFECGNVGWHIITNSGSSWFLFNTGVSTVEPFSGMPALLKGLYDVQHAWPDSTAAGNWVSFEESGPVYTHNTYLLGRYANGTFADIKELVFLEVSDSTYRFHYADRDKGLADTVLIEKDAAVNFVYYSFDSHEQVNSEPDKSTYDLVFGSYFDLATNFGITIPYLVGGAWLNAWETSALLDSTNEYTTITTETLSAFEFTKQRDIPGYRWKEVTVDVSGGGAATYAVKTNYNYVIHTAQGNYFSMRFLSYSLDGRSGYPQFEYQKLE